MNLPNALSLFRLFLVPVFLLVFFSDTSYAYQSAVGIFLLAGLTDMLDGYLARKYDQITVLGRILDPLADKLMVTSALVAMSMTKMIPTFVCVLYIGKELFQIVGGAVLFKYIKDMPPSNFFGKAATTMLYITIVCVILFRVPETISKVLFGVTYGLVFIALGHYVVGGVKLLKEIKR